ncbi:MAG: Na+/H+ antiporter NhaA [Propionibacteriales bacterium]|nr:Na+/H+ antiporter NhaA [Propionibacteriales bacterium]
MPSVHAPTDDAPSRRARRPLPEFLHDEAVGGVVLLVATVVALVWVNSPAGDLYERLWHASLTIGSGPAAISDDLQHWVNDAAMVLFFFLVGLEIKRELAVGELREPRAAALPVVAAVGGVVVPAALYLGIAGGTPAASGWGIPMATDIAFAIGVLAVLGRWIPAGARLFLLSVAIVDDIIAVVVIAIAYSGALSFGWLAAALGGLALVVVMRRAGTTWVAAYVVVGVLVWYAMFHSGVHATIAGVALGLLTPASPVNGRRVLEDLEHYVHPVAAFVVVPLFALANAGVDLRGGVVVDALSSRPVWAVVVGLLVGKTVGIGAAVFAARRLGLVSLPADVPGRVVWGLATLAGIGFTVSLFITGLAFDDPALIGQAKVGILTGSALAAAVGAGLLRLTRERASTPRRID